MTPDMHSDPDAELVLLCQRTQATALEGDYRRLYDRYKDRVYNVCYRITGNASDALDASQETFGILFRRLVEFRFESRFSSWVYRVAVNASIDVRRRQRSRRLASLEALQDSSEDGAKFELADPSIETASTVAPGERLKSRNPRPGSSAVTVHSAGGTLGFTIRRRLPSANATSALPTRSTRVTVGVHSGQCSTSLRTAHSRSHFSFGAGP